MAGALHQVVVGGRLNISENCLDRHVRAGLGGKVAYHWEGEPGDTRTVTYQDLLEETQRCANALRELGVRQGDRVATNVHPTRPLPRWRVLRCSPIVFVQPKMPSPQAPRVLAHRVSDMARGAAVDGALATAGVLGDVRGDAFGAHGGHEVARVAGLVRAERRAPAALGRAHQGKSRIALGARRLG